MYSGDKKATCRELMCGCVRYHINLQQTSEAIHRAIINKRCDGSMGSIVHKNRLVNKALQESVGLGCRRLKIQLNETVPGCSDKNILSALSTSRVYKFTILGFLHNHINKFEGTWQRRGPSSHQGIVTAISTDTGMCVDFEVLSNICTGCR